MADTEQSPLCKGSPEYVDWLRRIEALEDLAARAERGEFDDAAAAHAAAKQARGAAFG